MLNTHQQALSVAEILVAARHDSASISRATVYRQLKRLVAQDLATTVELPGEPPRYEAAGRRHHHHFRCRRCERVYDLPGCPGGLQALVPNGFTLEGHHVVLDGVCSQC